MLDDTFRSEWSRVVAIVAKRFGDLDLAEDAASEAFAAAAERWGDAAPSNPRAWLVAAARNAAIDRIRRMQLFEERKPLLVAPDEPDTAERDQLVPDERLELIFACVHPALSLDAQVALTLRAVAGVRTERIAEVFLVNEETMKRRLSRAKKKIAATKIPFSVPSAEQLQERVEAVLAVIYLIFNEGYVRGGDVAEEALYLARVLSTLLPLQPEAHGLLALILFLHARAEARRAGGRLILFADQDRRLWNTRLIGEARLALSRARALEADGAYYLQAAIEEARIAEPVDSARILRLYESLAERTGSPVVLLNAAVAMAEFGQTERALTLVETLPLDDYLYYHSTRAELLRRLGRDAEAGHAYQAALQRASDDAEREFLQARLDALSP